NRESFDVFAIYLLDEIVWLDAGTIRWPAAERVEDLRQLLRVVHFDLDADADVPIGADLLLDLHFAERYDTQVAADDLRHSVEKRGFQRLPLRLRIGRPDRFQECREFFLGSDPLGTIARFLRETEQFIIQVSFLALFRLRQCCRAQGAHTGEDHLASRSGLEMLFAEHLQNVPCLGGEAIRLGWYLVGVS